MTDESWPMVEQAVAYVLDPEAAADRHAVVPGRLVVRRSAPRALPTHDGPS